MKRFDFIICYDISDAKRIRRVAKRLEGDAIRIQKSIFFVMQISKNELRTLVEKLLTLIDEKNDDLRVYKVEVSNSLNLKSGIDLREPNIIGGIQ